jgi:uncharacterized protein YodC (DUF2158 family)
MSDLPALSTMDVKIGDSVQLKTGGPPMAVENVNVYKEIVKTNKRGEPTEERIIEERTTVDCVWFTSGDGVGEWHGPFRANFNLALLDSKV